MVTEAEHLFVHLLFRSSAHCLDRLGFFSLDVEFMSCLHISDLNPLGDTLLVNLSPPFSSSPFIVPMVSSAVRKGFRSM